VFRAWGFTNRFQGLETMFRLFGWYGHTIFVWPIAALRNELSANQRGVFSVTRHAETEF
jgi:hypothetical protein